MGEKTAQPASSRRAGRTHCLPGKPASVLRTVLRTKARKRHQRARACRWDRIAQDPEDVAPGLLKLDLRP
jgi:hypothetical protein